MPITEEQRKQRIHHLGSSDMAAILGVDRWKTPTDIYLEKKGRLTEEPDAMIKLAGSRFEDGVLDFAQDELGPLTRNVEREVAGTPIVAHIDAVVDASDEPVEVKTTGLFGPLFERWGDDHTDQVPERVIVQCHVHMLATDRPICHVPAFIGGRGFVMFQVPRNEDLAEICRAAAVRFWTENVEADVPPEGVAASLNIIKRLRRTPEKVTDVDPETVRAWLDAKEAASGASKALDEAQAAVLTAMGDAEAALCGDLGAITYFKTNRSGFTVKPTTFRTLRHRKKGL